MNEQLVPRTADERPVDLDKAHSPIVVHNYQKDPAYCPYCMRCPGLHRMRLVAPFLWKHSCGAVHDERQMLT